MQPIYGDFRDGLLVGVATFMKLKLSPIRGFHFDPEKPKPCSLGIDRPASTAGMIIAK